ncbi:MAG: PorV/PorQ family protein [Ignavibacteriaceae bacterium]
MITKKFQTFILFGLIISLPVFPQTDLNKTAQSTMNFLLVGTLSKACAMGEAYVTTGKGSESLFYNPAGLSLLNKTFDINLNYTQWIADINYISGAVAWDLSEFGTLGAHLITVDYGTINGTSLISPSEENLYPLGYKDNGLVSNVGAYVVGLSYAKSITQEFSMGFTFKLVGQNLGQNIFSGTTKDNDATIFAIDAGVRYQTGFKGFNFGMFIRNFSTNIKREEIDEQLPLLFSFGAAINLLEVVDENISDENLLTFEIDFLHQNNYSERVNMGLEYKFLGMISLRGGYQTNRDLASWSAGIGLFSSISDYDLEVNYSYSSFELFDSVNRLSLLFAL